MKKAILLLLVVFTLTSGALAQSDGLNQNQIRKIANAVVQIITFDDQGEALGSGSGTIVDPGGRILTNRHVVEGGALFGIYMVADMSELPVLTYFASVAGVSPDIDLAVLQIEYDADGDEIDLDKLKLPYISNANTDIAHGDRIYIFGFPDIGDGYLVLTQGSITTIENENIQGERIPIWYQTDAEISPGNSGGLAVNGRGEFIGIPTAVRSEGATGGRLGGITPYAAVDAILQARALVEPDAIPVSSVQASGGVSVDCSDGLGFDNGVEITVQQMRAGFNYTATAIGIGDFDPVLAVYDPQTNRGDCVDDAATARNFQANLPTSGPVPASNLSSQLVFSQNSGANMADVSLVVGGLDNASGEFVLILEGMAATQADGKGDPFTVRLTPGMIGSGTPLSVYMISKTNQFDPFMFVADEDFDIFTFSDDSQLYCDDAGNNDSCWGDSENLSSSFVSLARGRDLPGFEYDAMLQIPLDAFSDVTMDDPFYMTFLMTSYQQRTFGDYLIAFHAGTR